jgi:hypothetical protein
MCNSVRQFGTPKLKRLSVKLKELSAGVLWRCGTWAETVIPAKVKALTLRLVPLAHIAAALRQN